MTKSKRPGPIIPTKIRKTIEEAMHDQARAKELEDSAKGLKAKSKETLLPIMTAYGIKDYTVQGLGKTTVKISKGSSIDTVKLREQLLIEGVSPTKIDNIISRASKTWETEYVEFKRERN